MAPASSLSPRAVALFALAAGVVPPPMPTTSTPLLDGSPKPSASAPRRSAQCPPNQVALALGVFFLLPRAHFLSNRKLVLICITVQLLSLGIMALAESYALFLAAARSLVSSP